MVAVPVVNTTLGNVKTAITGTYRRVSPEHARPLGLGSFAGYNRPPSSSSTLILRLDPLSVGRDAPLPFHQLHSPAHNAGTLKRSNLQVKAVVR